MEKSEFTPSQTDTAEEAMQLRTAEIEAYAMKPEMDMIAEDRAAAQKTPLRWVHSLENASRLEGGDPILTVGQKQQHWELEGKAQYAAKEAVRLDEASRDLSRGVTERRVALGGLHAITSTSRKAVRPKN